MSMNPGIRIYRLCTATDMLQDLVLSMCVGLRATWQLLSCKVAAECNATDSNACHVIPNVAQAGACCFRLYVCVFGLVGYWYQSLIHI